jgi:hypothetical protein
MSVFVRRVPVKLRAGCAGRHELAHFWEAPPGLATMIYQHDGRFVFECDGCSARFEHAEDEGGLTAAWVAARRDGWRARKIGGEWEHKCPKCGAGLD